MLPHVIFIILHVFALCGTAGVGLLVTIPLHLIYVAVNKPSRGRGR